MDARDARFRPALLYPLAVTPAVLVVLTAAVDALLLIDLFRALLAAFAIGMLSVWFARYAFVVFDHSAEGYPEPPELSYQAIAPFTDLRHVKLGLLVAAGFLIAHWAEVRIGPAGAYLAAGLLLALAPAAVMALALESSLSAAVNPRVVVGTALRLGPIYAAALTGGLGAAGLAALAWGAGLGAFPALAVSLYLMLVVFHLLGRAAFEGRSRLGLRAANAPEEHEARLAEETRRRYARMLDQVYDQRRPPERALGRLLELIRAEGDGLEAHGWFHRELMQWEDPRVGLAHAQVYLERLVAAGRAREAAEVLRACRAADEEFQVTGSTAAQALGEGSKEQRSQP
ncbi:MAG: hypothetical protein GWO02_01500 [Gammaproteobacteria bacterium]|nr:hypothetical protein [Gammaproteobacteria bacterium]